MDMATRFAEIFAEWLRQARKKRNIKQIPFAAAAGMSQGNISDYERGKKTVTSDGIEKCLVALQLDAATMIIEMAVIAHELAKKGNQPASLPGGGHAAKRAESQIVEASEALKKDRGRRPKDEPAKGQPG